jgi:hypothetical protein
VAVERINVAAIATMARFPSRSRASRMSLGIAIPLARHRESEAALLLQKRNGQLWHLSVCVPI